MSWQSYVDSNLVGTGKIARAAILGLQGGVWAASPGFSISAEEQAAIVKAFSDAKDIQASGIRLSGDKYFTLFVADRTMQGKKVLDGVVIVKTIQAVLVAVYVAPFQAGEVAPIVESLADYLIERNY